MADPIILDKNVITSIARGNQQAAAELRAYLQQGTRVYIAHAAYDELVTRAQNPKQRGEYESLLKDAGITKAPPGSMGARVDVYARNIETVPGPNAPRLKEYSRRDDPTKPGDVFIVAQAKANNARLWTFDEKMQRAAAQQGVELAPQCRIGDISGVEDVTTGRKLLGLSARAIGSDGRPVRQPGGSGSGSGGGHPIVGVADNTLPVVGGPSPTGTAKIAGTQLALEGFNFILNAVNDYLQKQRVEQALNEVKQAIAAERNANPRMGILLLFYFTQYEAPSASIIKPGAEFNYLIWGKGVTHDEAARDALSVPSMSRGTVPADKTFSQKVFSQKVFSQEVWIPPLLKSTITTAKAPFKPIAKGRFILSKSEEATFQLVKFDSFFGFDDIVQKSIKLPTNADFVILEPKPQVIWYNRNGKQTVDVPLKDAMTPNGQTIKVVDLDTYNPFGGAKAAMVFPADAWTEEVFGFIESTRIDPSLALHDYLNFGMIRWIRPENIHLQYFL